MLVLRLSQSTSSWCRHATPTQFFIFFGNCHYFGEVGIMLLLQLSQGISSGCHQ